METVDMVGRKQRLISRLETQLKNLSNEYQKAIDDEDISTINYLDVEIDKLERLIDVQSRKLEKLLNT